MEDKSIVIGITGGIGTGKSTVADIFESHNIKVLKADNIAKELMATNTEIIDQIIKQFGTESYLENGSINTVYISNLVFNNENPESTNNLNQLNQIVHPVVIQWIIDSVEKLVESGEKLIVVESALIYEAELDEGFDYIILVDCSDDVRISRVMQRNGLTKEQVMDRINSQISQTEKKGAADFVIDNSADLEKLKENVEFLIKILQGLL